MPLNMKKEPLDLFRPSSKLREKRKGKIYTASRLEKWIKMPKDSVFL